MPDISPDTQNRVTLRPVTDAKFQAQDFGKDQIGRGLQAFGQGIGEVAEAVKTVNDIHDEAVVKEIDIQALAAASDAKREVENAKGKDALLAGEMFNERLSNIRKEAMSKLTNDRQKRMFGDVFERRSVADTAAVNAKVDRETFTYNVDTTKGLIESHIARAADVYNEADTNEFDKSIITIANQAKVMAALVGDDEQTLKSNTEKLVGAAYAGVFERMRVEDPIKARKFLDDHAGKVPADLETQLRQKVQPAYEEMRAEQLADEAIAGVVEAALDSRIEDPAASPAVQPDPAKAEKNATFNSDPLRGKSYKVVEGGQFGAPRDGGKRAHGGLDYAAPEGTPVYPRGVAKVTEIDTIGKTDAGYYVKFQYADGTTGSYSHLRNVNVKPGDTIDTDTVVGSIGRTGRGGKPAYGSHLHEVIRDASGRAVDPRKYRPGQPVVDIAAPGYAPKYEGNTVDIKAAYAVIEKKYRDGDISLSLRKEAMRAIDDRARREDVIKDRAYDAAEQSAIEVEVGIIQSGGDITDPAKQIPNWSELSPSVQRNLLNRAASNNAAIAAEAARAAEAANKATIEGNYDTYLRLEGMADTNPELFMKVPLDKYRSSFPKDDWQRLRRTQEEYRRQGTYRPQLAPERSKVAGLVNSVLGDAMLDPQKLKDPDSKDSKRRAYLISEAMRRIDAYNQSGTKLNDAQISELVLKPLLRKVVVDSPGFFGSNEEEMPWYRANMEGYSDARVAP